MDFGSFQPAATTGPVNASASASAPTSGWLSQLQMQEHHLHSSTTQQRVPPDAGSVDVDISMLGTADDTAASSSSMLPSVHTHSHPQSHSLPHQHQHQSTHHSMPVSHPHTYYSLSPFPYTTFNYGLSPYSSIPTTSQGSSSGSNNQQHWTVPISSYSSLNGATNSQPTASSSSTPASGSSTKASSRSPLPQHQPQQPQMQSPAPSQQQLHSPVMMHQQQPPQHQYQPQQVQMQAMQSPHMQHSHSSTPTPPSTQHHQVSHAAPYLQQQQSQITIDPTLMLANYTNSYPPSAFYSYPQTLSLSPSLLHNPSSSSLASANTPLTNHSSSQLAQAQLQHSGTLPSTTGMPSRSALTSVLNGLLSAKILTSPNQIVRTIMTIGPTEVELPTRLQVLSKVRDCADNDFYQAWALNTEAMDIIREWLKNTIMSKSGEWEETIMPLLHVVDRLPLTVESLRSSKIGKVIVKLKEVSASSVVKDMASSLENRWRSLVNTVDKSSLENGPKRLDGAKGVEVKKRKLEEASMTNKAAPAMKKLALSKPTMTTGNSAILTKPIAVKKEPSAMMSAVKGGTLAIPSSTAPSTTVRDSKSDSSFFSAPKPKPKLPSFKKAPPLQAAKKDGPDPNVAQPSSVDPFKDALAAMTRARGSPTPSAAVAAANAAYVAQFHGSQGSTTGAGTMLAGNYGDAMITSTDSSTAGIASLPTATGKKKKKVSFKAEKDLVQIKFIEPAVYDDDVMGANGIYHNVRDLDRDEGAAMHKQIFEEQIDWIEPLLLDLPAGADTPRGQNSEEKITQEEREKSALNALYMPSQIPESPAEPTSQIPDDEVDASVKHMLSGNEVRELTPDRGHGTSAGSGGPGVGLLGSALSGNGDMSTMSALSVQGLISQLAAGLSAVGGSGSGGVGGGLSGLAAPLGNGDIVIGDPAALAAPTQPMVDLKQLGLDINLIAQLASQHPNLTSSSSSTLSSSVNGYVLGAGASQASTGSNGSGAGYNDQNDWDGVGPSSSQYGDYSPAGQYEDDNGIIGHRSKNWDPSSDQSWRGRGGGGRGGRGSGNGRGGSGFRHTKRKLCNFFANGRCRYGDQCDFLHEL